MNACRSCGRDNKPGRKFCAFCGTAMATGCPACGTPFEAGELFCGECGTALPQGAAGSTATIPPPLLPVAAPVAERRLVTVLFADLVGFTPFAEQRDAEEVRETLGRYFEVASDVVGRYGGTIEKFIGDAVMAVWGVPRAHEDDAERAVRAALDLVDAIRVLGPGIRARAGVLTGEAAVTLGATNQGMVAGDLVNTAARLQSVAIPGTVLVGEPTMRAASKAIAFEPAGEQSLKGKESPVPAHRALRVIAEVGGRNRQEGLEAPFVGRDEEMRQLRDLFHATAKDRRVRLISVLGPAGIGKSRFAWEFLKYVDGLASTVWWHQGRSPAYGSGLAYWALGEMVRGRCGLLESDDESTTRVRVSATLGEHVPDPAERAWLEPALLALLGVGDRSAPSDQLFAAWRTFFERLAATAPVVMLFEDLHWADPGTLDFIDHLLDWTRDQPITIITLARPELLERRPGWGGGRRHFLALTLDPLPPAAMRELLAGLVPGLPERAVASIVARADGVPLYAVEMVRSLLADGRLRAVDGRHEPVGDLSELAVPDSLIALIASRLDALDPVDRSLLQDASVLGQSFTPAALAAIAGGEGESQEPRLRALVRRELLTVEADPRSPERGQYAFVQALIREVAYNTLSRKDRRAKHLAAARWFESQGSDELAGALARHYLAAWQQTPEGPEADALAGQARLALVGAADRAEALFAREQAVELLQEALTVTTVPVERGHLLCRIGELLDALSRYADEERLGSEAIAIAREHDDPELEARAARVRYLALVSLQRRSEAVELIERTLDKLADLPPDRSILRLRRHLAVQRRYAGDPDTALALIESVLDVAEVQDLRDVTLESLLFRAEVLFDRGRMVEANGLMGLVRAQAPELGRMDLEVAAWGSEISFLVHNDPRAASDATAALLDHARRSADMLTMISHLGNLAELAFRVGDWELGRASVAEILALETSSTDRAMALELAVTMRSLEGADVTDLLAEAATLVAAEESASLDRIGTMDFAAGRYPSAAVAWLELARRSPLNAPLCLPRAARAYRFGGDLDGMRTALDALVALSVGGPVVDAERLTIEAGIAAMEGRVEDARRRYRDVRARWRELRLPWDEALVCLDMAVLLGPDDPDVPGAAAYAREMMERLGARPFLAKLDAALVGSAAPA